MEAVRFHQDFREAKQEMQVLWRGRQRERIDRERAFINAHLKVSAVKKPGQIFVAAAQIKDACARPIFLKMGKEKIHQEALAAAARPKNGRVGDILIVQVQKKGRLVLGL